MGILAIQKRCILLFILMPLPNHSFSLSRPIKLRDIDISSRQQQSLDISRKGINVTDNITQIFQQTNDTMSSSYSKVMDTDLEAREVFHAVLTFEKVLAEEKILALTAIHAGPEHVHGVKSAATVRNCSSDINFVTEAAREKNVWALKMIDACGKSGSGILRDQLHFVGNYDECMDLDTGQDFDGRYCTTSIWISKIRGTFLSKPVKVSMGVCFPSSCDATDVEEFLNEYSQSLTDITAYAAQTQCQERHLKLTTKAKVAICICSVFATILVAATVYDVFYKRMWLGETRYRHRKQDKNELNGAIDSMNKTKDSEIDPIIDKDAKRGKFYSQDGSASQTKSTTSEICDKLLMSFSVFTNGSKLLSVTQSRESIDCIHGIRFISMTWVILLHLYSFGGSVWGNAKEIFNESYDRWTFMVILNAQFSVDTFFALSGLLMSYLNLKELSKDKVTFKFFGMFYFHRFWRLTPPYMLILMTYVALMKYMSDGPMWPQHGFDTDQCEDNWWTNLLYINNFVETANACMSWTWYLACDMQFFIVSPLLLLPLLYYDWKGLLSAFAFLLGTAICSGVITRAEDLESVGSSITYVLYNQLSDYFPHYYMKPYTRIGPFVVGIVTGFLLLKCEMKARLSKHVVALGWMAATAMALALVFGLYDHVRLEEQASVEVRALYNALCRIAWGTSVCWVIFACVNGYGGFVNTFLSWKAFVPLSRLTYCAYLIHPLVLRYYRFSQLKLIHQSTINIAFDMCGVTVITYALAFLFSMAYEVPMAGLEKVIRSQGKRKH